MKRRPNEGAEINWLLVSAFLFGFSCFVSALAYATWRVISAMVAQ